MQYALHADDAGERLFDVGVFTQRRVPLGGTHREPSDEVVYVLEGRARLTVDDREYGVGPGYGLFFSAGTTWSAEGDAVGLSVLVHHPEPSTGHEVVDLDEVEKGTATAGRQFVLGPGCASATQFVGLIPPGRAPDHFHRYDEVIYVLEGEGELSIGGENVPLRPGSCIHLPRTLVHCLANTGDSELRVLGVFRPAGSPAEAYYPDGTPAVVAREED